MTQLLQNAVYSTALILAAALLRRALKDRLTPEARLALWAVCLFRLLTPAAPESVFSLWGLSRLFQPQQTPAAPSPVPVAGTPQLYAPAQTGPSPAVPAISWETVLLAVWLAVGGLLAVRYVLSWIRTRRAVACAIPVERNDPRYVSLPRCARLREGPMEGAPLTFGAIKPTVVLPPALEGQALDCVLAHEGVHASRRDNLWHYVMAAALVIHWWNPAVWLMARLLRRDIELSCDRAALKKLGADRRAEYASTLVSMATQESGPAFCQTFGRKAAEERILSVMKFKKTSIVGAVLSLTLVLAVTVAFASEPKEPDELDEYAGGYVIPDGVTLTDDVAKCIAQLHAGTTRDEVHQLLGEPHNYLSGLYGDTYFLERLQDLPVTEPTTEAPLLIIYYDNEDFHGGVSKVERVIYRADGKHSFDLIPYTAEDQPTYVPPYDNYDAVSAGEDGAIDPSLKEAIEAALRDRIQATLKDALEQNGYHVHLPTFDEDGNSASGTAGEEFYSYDFVSDSPAAVGGDPVPVPSAAPAPSVELADRSSDSPDLADMLQDQWDAQIKNRTEGILTEVYTAPSASCGVEGCTVTESHTTHCNGFHSGGVCDGSCGAYSLAYPSSSTGHHSDSHHGNGHH